MRDLLPPCDINAERSVLGAMLLSPFATDTVLPMITASDLYRLEHQRIYSAIASLSARGIGVDLVTVASELSREQGYDEIMASYLADLRAASSSRGNVASQAKIIQEHAIRRRLTQTGYEIAAMSADLTVPIDDLVTMAEGQVTEASLVQHSSTRVRLSTALSTVKAQMEERSKIVGIPGIRSGIDAWDVLTRGLQRKKFYVFAGRPGMGKTAAAACLLNAAGIQGKRVVFFSLEMTKEEIAERIAASLARVSLTAIQEGRMTASEVRAFDIADRAVNSWKIDIEDKSGLTLPQIAAEARRVRSELGGLDLLIVDYLQIVRPDPSRRADNRAGEVSLIANGMKELSKVLDCAVVGLAQINRGVEGRENKRPALSDLKESGGIEEAADVVTALYRPCYYQPQEAESQTDGEPAEWIVLKGRNCRTGTAKVVFHGPHTRFEDMKDEVPSGF